MRNESTFIIMSKLQGRRKTGENMKKSISICFICMMVVLFSACGYEKGSDEATIEEIKTVSGTNQITVKYGGYTYSWIDKTGDLKYGECTIDYKYKDNKNLKYGTKLETLKITNITQTEAQTHEEGELRNIEFKYSYSTPTAPCKILDSSFSAAVTYWGDSTTHYENVKMLDDSGKEIRGWKINASGNYDFYLQWGDITGTVSLYISEQSPDYHKCVECGREGTNKYESFTGKTEYYCDTHYKELMELFGYLLTH